ncbi:hypothetical protein MCAP1_001144 [Malassezia caprae]|uniref:Uncharacterized protein n=1 Tax=Malassezia caprae TaxID=1381934 RepID=A0AAF0E918_9BASI|nr:hypothetical protein MCAP1_001144 [Malassezia caprae]
MDVRTERTTSHTPDSPPGRQNQTVSGPPDPTPAVADAQSSIPPTTDALVRLVGPDVGEWAHASAAGESLSISTLDQWIKNTEQNACLSAMELFVNVHRSNTTLGLASPASSLAWMPQTQASLQLPAPTHTMVCRCDCSAPYARVNLVVHAPRQTPTATLTPPPPQGHGALALPGWHLATDQFATDFNHPITLPLVLDSLWLATGGVVALTLTIEALDEDRLPLEKPNTMTTKWEATCASETPDVWQIRQVSQHARMGPFVLQLHELFGMDAHREQPLVPPPEPKTEQAPQGGTLALNESLVHSAALVSEDLYEDGSECPICMSEATSTLLFPLCKSPACTTENAAGRHGGSMRVLCVAEASSR